MSAADLLATSGDAPLKTGDVLPNGATVLLVTESKTVDDAVVLAVVGHKREFVTWRCATNGEGTCWGHYTRNLATALADYTGRAEALR